MINIQLGRRNLSDKQIGYYRGLQYEREKKKSVGRSDRNFGEEETSTPKTAERLADQHNVTERTIREDGKFAKAVDKIADG